MSDTLTGVDLKITENLNTRAESRIIQCLRPSMKTSFSRTIEQLVEITVRTLFKV